MLLEMLAGYSVAVTVACVLLYREKREATERLYAAWKDGAIIPSLEPVTPEPEHVDSPFDGLPNPVMEWLERWEEPAAKLRWAHRAHAILAKRKGDVVGTINELDEPNWG